MKRGVNKNVMNKDNKRPFDMARDHEIRSFFESVIGGQREKKVNISEDSSEPLPKSKSLLKPVYNQVNQSQIRVAEKVSNYEKEKLSLIENNARLFVKKQSSRY